MALLALLLPLQAQAQSVALTLICQVETAHDTLDPEKHLDTPQNLSVIVRMKTDGSWLADVEISNPANVEISNPANCERFRASFDELKVYGSCEDSKALAKFDSWVNIDRVTGAFHQETLLTYNSASPQLQGRFVYDGHCKPSSKLF